jgi:hypothetical protein
MIYLFNISYTLLYGLTEEREDYRKREKKQIKGDYG